MTILSADLLIQSGWSCPNLPDRASVFCALPVGWLDQTEALWLFLRSLFFHYGGIETRSTSELLICPDQKICLDVSLKKKDLEEIQDFLAVPALWAKRRFVVLNVEGFTESGAQSLLKVLEEPLSPCLILLLGAFRDHLPDTLLSRCFLCRWNVSEWNEAQTISMISEEEFYQNLKHYLEQLNRGSLTDYMLVQNPWNAPVSPYPVPSEIWSILSDCPDEPTLSKILWRLFKEMSHHWSPDQIDFWYRSLIWWKQQQNWYLKPKNFLFRLLVR